jgi:hypothetical protein
VSGATGGGPPAHADDDDATHLNGHAPAGGGRSGTALLTPDDPPAEEDRVDDPSEGAPPVPTRSRRPPPAGPTEDLFPPGWEARQRRDGRRRRLVVLATAGVAALAAIGTWSVVGRASSPAVAVPATAVMSSVHTTVATGSANLSLTMRVRVPGSGEVDASGTGAVDLHSNEGRLLFTFGGSGPLAGAQLKEVFVGDTIYFSLPQLATLVPGKPWISQPLTSGALITPRNSDPGALLAMLGADGNHVVPLGASTVDGTAVHGYRVTVSPAGLRAKLSQAGLPSGIAGAAAAVAGTAPDVVTVYVADGTGQVRRIAADIDLSLGSNPVVASVTEDLSDYGKPIAVSPPPAAQVITLSQYLSAVQGASPAVSA